MQFGRTSIDVVVHASPVDPSLVGHVHPVAMAPMDEVQVALPVGHEEWLVGMTTAAATTCASSKGKRRERNG